jgi:hypothetical protein
MTRRGLCTRSISPQEPSTSATGSPAGAAVIIPDVHTPYYYDWKEF